MSFDGTLDQIGGIAAGNMYSRYLPLYEKAAAVPPPADIQMALSGTDTVEVHVTNTQGQPLSATLHIVLVERHRPYKWKDMDQVDFVARAMLPSVNGQEINLPAGDNAVYTQRFTLLPDWNYCALVAFIQMADRQISQGAILPLDRTVPALTMSGAPQSGSVWGWGSSHTISWSSDRPLETVELQLSTDGGQTWGATQASGSNGSYTWTVPQITSSQCVVAVRDPYGGAAAVSGIFTIARTTFIKGDINGDGVVDSADRKILVDFLLENKAIAVPGTDLNEDGVTDILDLIYLDTLIRGKG